ncbi:hypothetical protein [Rothia halotolerans]|uniref:hypothetical protein n=1 Tax=Rothia halotolerans TaxID=405770 RepID=UPI00101C477C|nr:hypothetical protein [Rothia halotolerans]
MADGLTRDAGGLARHADLLLKSADLASRLPGVDAGSPWSAQSLMSAEKSLLTSEEVALDDYAAFIGRGLVERFGGAWVDVSDHVSRPGAEVNVVGIAYPDMEHTDILNSVVHLARLERSGTHWVSLFESNDVLRARRGSGPCGGRTRRDDEEPA